MDSEPLRFDFESETLAKVFVDRVALYVRDAACVREGTKVLVQTEPGNVPRIQSLARASYGSYRRV